LVAVGVVEHSDYRADLWRRLRRTLQALYLITYGTRAEADSAGQAVRAVHAGVVGTTTTRLGRYPAGTAYSASDPELMLWVHATLVECSLAVYLRFVERLSRDEQEQYYREMGTVGRIFGVPGSVLPRSLGEFHDYFQAQAAGDTITVTPPARAVAAVILAARPPAPMRILAPAHRVATAGLLPPRLRREYGLHWSPIHAGALPFAAHAMRLTAAPIVRVASHLGRAQPAPLVASPSRARSRDLRPSTTSAGLRHRAAVAPEIGRSLPEPPRR
jgi:uncharacterized protein (DUF2236 family)